jgi:hypothetical protein
MVSGTVVSTPPAVPSGGDAIIFAANDGKGSKITL